MMYQDNVHLVIIIKVNVIKNVLIKHTLFHNNNINVLAN